MLHLQLPYNATRPLLVLACLIGLQACGEYDCKNPKVQEEAFEIIRQNLFDILSRRESELQANTYVVMRYSFSPGALAFSSAPHSGLPSEKLTLPSETINVIIDEYKNYVPSHTEFRIISLYEEDSNATEKSHVCRANLELKVPVPKTLIAEVQDGYVGPGSFDKQKGFFKDGFISTRVEISYTVRPDLSGNSGFIVTDRW